MSALITSRHSLPLCVLQFLDLGEFLEICSLVGTVCADGAHLHATLGRADGSALAGHVLSLTVQTTAEVVLGEAEGLQFARERDASTGFRELVVRERTEQAEASGD